MSKAGKMPTLRLVPATREDIYLEEDDWHTPDLPWCETCVDEEGDSIELFYVPGSDKFWYNGDHTAHSIDFECPQCGGRWTERCD